MPFKATFAAAQTTDTQQIILVVNPALWKNDQSPTPGPRMPRRWFGHNCCQLAYNRRLLGLQLPSLSPLLSVRPEVLFVSSQLLSSGSQAPQADSPARLVSSCLVH